MKKVNSEKFHNLGKMFIFSIFVAALFGLVLSLPTYANNIQVGTPTLTGQDTSQDYTYVQFDLSWDNSWRTSSAPNNWDAAWVFVKYKKTGDVWKHATLDTTAGNHTAPSGSTITPSNDGKGVFIYRSSDGSGSNNWNGVGLRWNYGANGLADSDTVTVKVFAIEMVYIPSGNFYLGVANTAGSEYYGFYKYGTTGPYQITSEGAINIGQTNDYLWAKGGVYVENPSTLPADFPKGYNAFYCMKHEISQGQYADFLNTLTPAQDGTRFPNANGSYRHTIGGSQGNRSASVPDRACNYLSWADGCAYADWAGLRPMTELEFEKICRGPQSAVNNEYAWGNANVASTAYTLNDNGQPNETVSNPASDPTGNASYSTTDGSIDGPLRCGIFATGRGFTGVHGDGALDANGNADVSNWPGTSASGAGFRGGGWCYDATDLRVSDRVDAGGTFANRGSSIGWRGVRVSP